MVNSFHKPQTLSLMMLDELWTPCKNKKQQQKNLHFSPSVLFLPYFSISQYIPQVYIALGSEI